MAFNEQILEGFRPNLFELLAQEAMGQALRPALDYFIRVVVDACPMMFGRLARYVDELWVVIEGAVQLFFIVRYDGSFAEYFYDLKRVPQTLATNITRPLSGIEKVVSLLFLVLVPYTLLKLDRFHSYLMDERDAGRLGYSSPSHHPRTFFKFLYFRLYPTFRSLWEGLKLVYRFSYLFHRTQFYSPLLWLAGVRLSRNVEAVLESAADSNTSTSIFKKIVDMSVPLSLFGLKFLEWWYSSEHSEVVRKVTSLPIPRPPGRIKSHTQGVQLPTNTRLCPLCLNSRRNPTAIACSGFVFCYACIHGYVKTHGHCPITLIPTSDSQLVRLYIQQQ